MLFLIRHSAHFYRPEPLRSARPLPRTTTCDPVRTHLTCVNRQFKGALGSLNPVELHCYPAFDSTLGCALVISDCDSWHWGLRWPHWRKMNSVLEKLALIFSNLVCSTEPRLGSVPRLLIRSSDFDKNFCAPALPSTFPPLFAKEKSFCYGFNPDSLLDRHKSCCHF